MTTLDYAHIYETQYRPGARLRRYAARVAWVGLFMIRPRLALDVLAERRSTLSW